MNTPLTSTSVQKGERQERVDRRRFPRYRTNLPVRIRDRQQRTHIGHCFVIAEGGLGATLPEKISVGSIVELLFTIPTHAIPLKILALVRNQIDQQHGLEFLSLTEDNRLLLRQFCDKLATDQRNADKWVAY